MFGVDSQCECLLWEKLLYVIKYFDLSSARLICRLAASANSSVMMTLGENRREHARDRSAKQDRRSARRAFVADLKKVQAQT